MITIRYYLSVNSFFPSKGPRWSSWQLVCAIRLSPLCHIPFIVPNITNTWNGWLLQKNPGIVKRIIRSFEIFPPTHLYTNFHGVFLWPATNKLWGCWLRTLTFLIIGMKWLTSAFFSFTQHLQHCQSFDSWEWQASTYNFTLHYYLELHFNITRIKEMTSN